MNNAHAIFLWKRSVVLSFTHAILEDVFYVLNIKSAHAIVLEDIFYEKSWILVIFHDFHDF